MSFWICRNRSSTRAWVDRSRALTGSSQTISLGERARARAIATRWRWPPLNSRGSRWMASDGQAHLVQQFLHALLGRRGVHALHAQGLGEDVADLQGRVQRGVGILEDHLHVAAQDAPLPCGWRG